MLADSYPGSRSCASGMLYFFRWSCTAANPGVLPRSTKLGFSCSRAASCVLFLGPWNPVTGQPRLCSDRDIRNLTVQPLITSVIRSRRLQRAEHVVRAPEKRNIHKALYGQAMGRRPQGKPRMRWVDNVRQDATYLRVRDWQISARDCGQWKAS